MQQLKKINWTNTLFLTITPLVAVVGTAIIVAKGQLSGATVVLALFYTIATGLAITAGYHRLFSHLSYKAHFLVRLFYVLFGAAAFEGSVLEWSTDHRNHHRYTDTDKDPYDIKRGFWYAHIGWLFYLDTSARDFSNTEDLQKDPVVQFQHRYFTWLAILMGFVMPTLIAALWGDAWGGLIIAGALRITLNQHFTFCINSVCHLFGERTYSDRQSARDNWVTALFTYGEGFHNFHHQFPLDYRNGIRFYHYDPSKWLIKALSWFNLATDLKQVAAPKIIQYQLRMDEKRLRAKEQTGAQREFVNNAINPLRDTILQVLSRIEELEKSYCEFKAQGIESMKDKMEEYWHRLDEYNQLLRIARQELRYFLSKWSRLIRSYSRLSPHLGH